MSNRYSFYQNVAGNTTSPHTGVLLATTSISA